MIAIAYALEALKFTPTAILSFRIVTGLVLVAAGAWFFARPLSRKVTDEQVALYLEEHEPTLDSTILSAMEASERPGDWSPELIRRLVENAIERVHEIREGERIEREPMRRYVWVARRASRSRAIALFTFGPAYFRHTLSAIFVISRDVEAAAPYRIEVKPGNATVAKGADQMISATLLGFRCRRRGHPDSQGIGERVRARADGQGRERLVRRHAVRSRRAARLRDRSRRRALGRRTSSTSSSCRTRRRSTSNTPTRRTPASSRARSKTAATSPCCKGTDVKFTITPTMATKGGQVVLGEKETVPLAVNADGTLSANFTAQHDGFYRIELDSPAGERLTASPQYTVDLLRTRADGQAVEAGPRHRRHAGRGILRRGAGRR